MTGRPRPGWQPIAAAFVVWFLHFMVSWGAAEIWPHQWAANAWAWGSTVIALLAMAVLARRLKAQCTDGGRPGWSNRIARGAVAIASVAVVFSALPSVVFVP